MASTSEVTSTSFLALDVNPAPVTCTRTSVSTPKSATPGVRTELAAMQKAWPCHLRLCRPPPI
eukprot:383289-Rhodomonas_salina.2